MLTLLATFTLIVGLFLTFFPPGGQVKFSNFYCRTLYLISTQYFFYLSLMNQILPWQLLESEPSGTYLNRSSLRLHPGCTALIRPACRRWKGSKFWCGVTRPQSVAFSCTTDDFIALKKTTQNPAIIPEDRASYNPTVIIAVASITKRKEKIWLN